MSRFDKHLTIGLGGIRCRCCFPQRGSKLRKIAFRAANKDSRRKALDTELKQLTDKEMIK